MSPEEETARKRYIVMNAVRIGGIAVLLIGIAMARGVVPGPWWLGAFLAVDGLITFFFAPTLLVRHWKKADRERPGGSDA
ncbi:MAG: hypothetical protein G9473_09515 [Erythrobacter sp.]|nr:MAG: hypothetical protein G9473_09515 [Erythrobacter sp.]